MTTLIEMSREVYDRNGNVTAIETFMAPDPRPVLAKEALTATDLVAIRCVKAGVAFPAAWQDYVTALRDIVNDGNDDLPTRPDYPEGT